MTLPEIHIFSFCPELHVSTATVFKKKFKMWNFLLFINKILLLYNTFYIYVLHSLILKTFTSFLVFLTISKMVAVTISGHNLK